MYLVMVNRFGCLSLPSANVRLTDNTQHDHHSADWAVKLQLNQLVC